MNNLKIPIGKLLLMLVLVSLFSVVAIGILGALLGAQFELMICAAVSGALGLRMISSRNADRVLTSGQRILIFSVMFVAGIISYYIIAIALVFVFVALGIYTG